MPCFSGWQPAYCYFWACLDLKRTCSSTWDFFTGMFGHEPAVNMRPLYPTVPPLRCCSLCQLVITFDYSLYVV